LAAAAALADADRMRDLRAAVRLLRHRPGFSAGVIATLTVALGAFTAIFSLVYALLVAPLPFAAADRVVVIDTAVGAENGRLALREYEDLTRHTRLFEEWAAYYRSQYNVTGGGAPQALTCTIGSSTLFSVLGVQPMLGDLWPREQDFTRQYLVLLSHHVWQQRFGGRPDIVGSTIVMDGASYRVTGVLPAGFAYPLQTDVVRAVTDYNAPHVRRYSVIARMRDGVTLEQAQAELDALSARFAALYPDTNAGVTIRATPLRDVYVGSARPFLWLLLAAVTLLLVIACVNVMNLLLSRAVSRSGDAAVRLALGARRRHLVRQSIAEALVLTAVGGILGSIGARWALRAVIAMIGADLPPWFSASIEPAALGAALLLVVLVAVIVGLLPALAASRTNIEQVLRQETGRTAGSARQQAVRRVLIGGQVAVATLLLVAAGAFIDGLRAMMRADIGFDAGRLLTFRTDPPFVRYPEIATTSEFYRRAIDSLAAQPGVAAVATNTVLPFARLDVASPRVAVDGRTTNEDAPFVNLQIVDPGYLHTMGILLLRGRGIERTDTREAPPIAVVSARVARRFWPDEDPVGRRVRLVWNQDGFGSGGGSEVALTVVGVAGDVRFDGIDDTSSLDVYAPHTQLFAGDSYFVVRAAASADDVRGRLRQAIDAVDADQSFFDVMTMEQRITRVLWQHRVATLMLGIFGVVALGLAAIGAYAVTAHAVAAHERDMGIRLALGSPSFDVAWLVVRRWLVPVGAGLVVGLVAGLMLARLLARLVGLAGPPGVTTPALLPLVLGAATAVACALPVWRVLRRARLADALHASQ
jgi:putative ABC transport system permease protein